jgi:serine/threonine-protein kinase
MDPSASDRNPVEELAEEFVERYRRGERPSLQEYAERYPVWADQIRALFPALVVMEKARPDRAEATGPDSSPPAGEIPLERLGDYRILREVGRGGMGVVYEAEQESLGRHVALKVLPAQAVLDPRQLQRFRREARAAARLHHTNIVPVHGVGEQDGLHYYVMQFIPGQSLDEVLDELRRLRHGRQALAPDSGNAGRAASAADVANSLVTGRFAGTGSGEPAAAAADQAQGKENDSSGTASLPGQRAGTAASDSGWPYWRSVARVGIQVAQALAYASSQGILHRDIKPSNLLLDTGGIVWVTDFGLAKAETDHDDVTHTGDIVGTLRYMAPERFQGKADVRSDLYALGLTVYEMLALRPAFDRSQRSALLAQVLHEDPPPLRKLDPSVPRDLETIVSKAIAREPAQRYQTPADLAEDLQRFLDDRPIKARRLGLAQRGWRWCRRNRAVAGLAATLSAALLAGTAVSTWQAVRATWAERAALRERDRAEANFELARDAVDRYFTRVSENPSMRAFGLEGLRKDLLLQAKEFYERFLREQPEEGALQADLARGYGRLGNICSSLGEKREAEANFGKSMAIFEELSRREPGKAEYQRGLAQAQRDLGGLLRETSRPEQARALLQQAVATAKGLARSHGNEPDYQHELALAYTALGDLHRLQQQLEGGAEAYEQAVAIEERLLRAQADESGTYRGLLGKCAGDLVEMYRLAARHDEAAAFSRRAIDIHEKLAREFPQEANYHYLLAVDYHRLGSLYQDTGRTDRAEAPLLQAITIGEQLVRDHPLVLDFVYLLGTCYGRLGRLENGRGQPRAVLARCEQAVPILQRVLEKEPRHLPARLELRDLRMARAIAQARLGEYAKAAEGAAEMAREEGLTPVDVYNLACLYSRCSEAAARDAQLSAAERDRHKELYARRAVDALRQALARGFKDLPALRNDTDFKPLWGREDFQRLLRELEEAAPAPAVTK